MLFGRGQLHAHNKVFTFPMAAKCLPAFTQNVIFIDIKRKRAKIFARVWTFVFMEMMEADSFWHFAASALPILLMRIGPLIHCTK